MKLQRKDFEIMAPVGSWESLAAALRAGADAIYFGIEGLNMRSRSSANFTTADMEKISRLCTRAKVKTYLTLNTVIYPSDMQRMKEIVDAASQAGVTALICADPAAILYARERGMEVHVSTQVNITNTEALRLYAQWADVVVLARELNLSQVASIYQDIQEQDICGPHGNRIKIEMFCHGALCMAVSGKCYMSLHEMNSSANRGACNQICRRGYRVTDLETGEELEIANKYIMSPKDLKTIHFLNKMADAGVRVFKIEGRARGPEYVYACVKAYSEALEAICAGEFTDENIKRWERELQKVFNRGFWDGYYLGQRLGEWSASYGSSATRTKRYIARATRYFPRLKVAEFRMEAGELRPGDEVVITGNSTGALSFEVEQVRLDAEAETMVKKGDLFSMPVPAKVRPGDRLYLWEKK